MENEVSAAVGYEPHRITLDEQVAKNFCSESHQYTSKDCWAIYRSMPEFKYSRIELIE